MRLGVTALLAFAVVTSAALAETREFVDSAGRKVTVPAHVTRVFAAGPPASVIVYSLAPEKLIGWTTAFRADERAFVPARYAELPALGRLTGRGNTANAESILAAKPDVIIDYGSIAPTYISLADRMQAQTGVPYVLIDGAFGAMEQAYTLLGALLGEEQRATERIAYVRGTLDVVDKAIGQIPPSKRPRVYYARGPNGLQTGLAGSINVESLERIGAINVAAEALGRGGLVNVSMEQVLAWNPDIIITIDPNFYRNVRRDPIWQTVEAVKSDRVYLAPHLPFGWIDFPPSVNRLIGLRWLQRQLYPETSVGDLREEVRRFYTMFYHQAPTDRQLDTLISTP